MNIYSPSQGRSRSAGRPWPVLFRELGIVGLLCLGGCTLSAYQNQRGLGPPEEQTRATFDVNNQRGDKAKNVLVLLALSGGGSRAAYFSAASMFALDDNGMLPNVDVISSVSGGSLTAAYYCLSPEQNGSRAPGGPWTREAVQSVLGHDYIWGYRGLIAGGYLIRPYSLPRTWFTAYTRTDAMADVFENGLFEKSSLSIKTPTFGELNPERPFLIINASNGTRDYDDKEFGTRFTFTREHFRSIGSDINSYPLAYGVMASAAFPGVFNYMTLADFKNSTDGQPRYIHLLDGGTVDNLGLETVRQIVLDKRSRYSYFVVILVDSYTAGSGVESARYDVRSPLDHLVDSNFLTTYDSLLESNREELLSEFIDGDLEDPDSNAPRPKIIFWHLTFQKIARSWPNEPDPAGKRPSLSDALNHIPTNFDLDTDDRVRIDEAVALLFKSDRECRDQIATVLHGGKPSEPDPCRIANGKPATVSKLRLTKRRKAIR